jgi:hypothetical protein
VFRHIHSIYIWYIPDIHIWYIYMYMFRHIHSLYQIHQLYIGAKEPRILASTTMTSNRLC